MINQTILNSTSTDSTPFSNSPKFNNGEEYWYIRTNDTTSCVIGFGKLTNQINKVKSAINLKSAYNSQFEKIFVFENSFEKVYVYSPSRVFSNLETLIKTVRGNYRDISFAVSAVIEIQKKGVNVAGFFN